MTDDDFEEVTEARVEDCGGGKLPRVLIVSGVRIYREGLVAMLAATGRVELVGVVAEADLPPYLSISRQTSCCLIWGL